MGSVAPQYVYRARLVGVHDGDTQTYVIDLGCHVAIERPVRLLGLNCPEVTGSQKPQGLAATAWATRWLSGAATATPGNWPLVIATQLDGGDKYGRLLGTIYRADTPESLNAALLAAGQAQPWDGHGPKPT